MKQNERETSSVLSHLCTMVACVAPAAVVGEADQFRCGLCLLPYYTTLVSSSVESCTLCNIYNSQLGNLPVSCVRCSTTICFCCFSYFASRLPQDTNRRTGRVYGHSWASPGSVVENLLMSLPLSFAIASMEEVYAADNTPALVYDSEEES